VESLIQQLQKHLGSNAAESPVVRQDFEVYERPNLHLAIEELVGKNGQRAPLGVVERDYNVTLARLVSEASANDFARGPVEFVDVELGSKDRLACVKRGVYLINDGGDNNLAILVATQTDSYPPKILIEVMARERTTAELWLRKLVQTARVGKAYRGKIFSLERNCYGGVEVKFHQLPMISRDQIILPQQLLDRIEAHTISFTRHAERLRASGRHLKRGILLHGPPGTGKTLTAMYLASRMENRTVIVLTGGGMGSIEVACHLARLLEPSTVILEDVDLIGTERGHQTVGANALLFELLNQMDGLNEDCDVLFVLTTNRPDVLEPALSSRPGRIDQALEVPLPDADCRERLIALYGKGLRLAISDMSGLVSRLEGASAAFIRELLRKAALLAAEESDAAEISVAERHLEDALSELVVAGGTLTQTLLGAKSGSLGGNDE
jgi:cell division protease FtsH